MIQCINFLVPLFESRIGSGQFHSIPEHPQGCLVITEPVNASVSDGKESKMEQMERSDRGSLLRWLGTNHVRVVVLLSLLHLGMAFVPARDSGGADQIFGSV